MSLVGTRPPTVEEVAQYEEHHRTRLAIKPGMTYHEDVAAVKDSFKKMLENGVYKADLFSNL